MFIFQIHTQAVAKITHPVSHRSVKAGKQHGKKSGKPACASFAPASHGQRSTLLHLGIPQCQPGDLMLLGSNLNAEMLMP